MHGLVVAVEGCAGFGDGAGEGTVAVVVEGVGSGGVAVFSGAPAPEFTSTLVCGSAFGPDDCVVQARSASWAMAMCQERNFMLVRLLRWGDFANVTGDRPMLQRRRHNDELFSGALLRCKRLANTRSLGSSCDVQMVVLVDLPIALCPGGFLSAAIW